MYYFGRTLLTTLICFSDIWLNNNWNRRTSQQIAWDTNFHGNEKLWLFFIKRFIRYIVSLSMADLLVKITVSSLKLIHFCRLHFIVDPFEWQLILNIFPTASYFDYFLDSEMSPRFHLRTNEISIIHTFYSLSTINNWHYNVTSWYLLLS